MKKVFWADLREWSKDAATTAIESGADAIIGNNAEDVRKLLKVPDRYTLISLIPAGYPAEVTIPRKKELDEIVFNEEYNE